MGNQLEKCKRNTGLLPKTAAGEGSLQTGVTLWPAGEGFPLILFSFFNHIVCDIA